MKKGDDMKKQGFTIIEVALVLGIAGLIFLMMMIALPALQRQQRDTARKEDINNLIANIKKYQTNNRGALPTNDENTMTNWDAFFRDYMKDGKEGFEDPSSGEMYNVKQFSCRTSGTTDDVCNDSDAEEAISAATGKSFDENEFNMTILIGAKCADDDRGALFSSNPRKVAVIYKLESGGLYCANT